MKTFLIITQEYERYSEGAIIPTIRKCDSIEKVCEEIYWRHNDKENYEEGELEKINEWKDMKWCDVIMDISDGGDHIEIYEVKGEELIHLV